MSPRGGPPAALLVGREALNGHERKSQVPDRGAAGAPPISARGPGVASKGKPGPQAGGPPASLSSPPIGPRWPRGREPDPRMEDALPPRHLSRQTPNGCREGSRVPRGGPDASLQFPPSGPRRRGGWSQVPRGVPAASRPFPPRDHEWLWRGGPGTALAGYLPPLHLPRKIPHGRGGGSAGPRAGGPPASLPPPPLDPVWLDGGESGPRAGLPPPSFPSPPKDPKGLNGGRARSGGEATRIPSISGERP